MGCIKNVNLAIDMCSDVEESTRIESAQQFLSSVLIPYEIGIYGFKGFGRMLFNYSHQAPSIAVLLAVHQGDGLFPPHLTHNGASMHGARS